VTVSTTVAIRLYIEGHLCDETQAPLGGGDTRALIGQLGLRHAEMVNAAASEGLAWLIEFVFPDGDHVRWGTDSSGMVEPMPIDDLAAALERRYGAPES
jgi:hypothetical protein